MKVILEGGNRRLVFARDGSLLVAASPPAGGGIPVDDEPQRLGNTYGKVLRIKSDGSIPRDNPFIGRKEYDRRSLRMACETSKAQRSTPAPAICGHSSMARVGATS